MINQNQPLYDELKDLKSQIAKHKATIDSGIFTTPEEKVAAKDELKLLEEKADSISWELSKDFI